MEAARVAGLDGRRGRVRPALVGQQLVEAGDLRGGCDADYPLTAPAVSPATMRFWKNSTRRISGTEMTIDAAAMLP